MVGNNLSLGQRVCILGQLSSKTFANKDNQNREKFNILVNELYANKPAENTNDGEGNAVTNTDYNSVFMLSHIVSDIHHFENFSRFYLGANITLR